MAIRTINSHQLPLWIVPLGTPDSIFRMFRWLPNWTYEWRAFTRTSRVDEVRLGPVHFTIMLRGRADIQTTAILLGTGSVEADRVRKPGRTTGSTREVACSLISV